MRGGGEPVGCSGTLRRKGIVQERKNTTTIMKKKKTILPGSFYMIMWRTIERVGRAALRTQRGASPLRPGATLSHLTLELRPENKTMRVAVRQHIDQEQRVY